MNLPVFITPSAILQSTSFLAQSSMLSQKLLLVKWILKDSGQNQHNELQLDVFNLNLILSLWRLNSFPAQFCKSEPSQTKVAPFENDPAVR